MYSIPHYLFIIYNAIERYTQSSIYIYILICFFDFSNILRTDIFKHVERLFFSTTLLHYVDLYRLSFITDCGQRRYFNIDENQPAQDQTKVSSPTFSLIKRTTSPTEVDPTCPMILEALSKTYNT